VPTVTLDGDVVKGHSYPRRYESGASWNYSGGLDWASLLVERLSGKDFEEHVEAHIAKPLGIQTFTWHLSRKLRVAEKLMRMSSRSEDGGLTNGPNPFLPEPPKETGGLGLYSDVHDYTRVLSDLLKDTPVLLSKPTSIRCLLRSSLLAAQLFETCEPWASSRTNARSMTAWKGSLLIKVLLVYL